MRTLPFTLILSLFWLLACEKNDVQVLYAPEISAACANCVSFDALAVGQVSYYQRLEGERFYDSNEPALNYQEDTLMLRVISQNGNVFTLEESIITAETDEIYQYSVHVDEEQITFSKPHQGDRSNLIGFHSEKSISFPLDLKAAPQARTKGWYIENDCDLVPCHYRMEGLLEDQTVSVYLDYSPMAYDGNGYYNMSHPEFLTCFISCCFATI
jgi:hypothetical protein